MPLSPFACPPALRRPCGTQLGNDLRWRRVQHPYNTLDLLYAPDDHHGPRAGEHT